MPAPPELPPRWTDPVPVVLVGTSLWLAGFAVLLVARLGFGAHPGMWLWTTLIGALLGGVGLGIFLWQRAAHRRGSKSAQRF